MPTISATQRDITTVNVDAIVNAANNALSGGGGVDGAIHRAAGPQLLAECRTLGRCETGDAVATRAYKLSAKWVFHTPGPAWSGGGRDEARLLRSCYDDCFRLAHVHGVQTIAFPAISTGAYRYPPDQAAVIALAAAGEAARTAPNLTGVLFVLYSSRDFRTYQRLLE